MPNIITIQVPFDIDLSKDLRHRCKLQTNNCPFLPFPTNFRRELRSHQDLRDAAAAERLPKVTAEAVYAAAMESHAEIMRRDEGSWATEDVLLMKQYRTELNFKLSAWDRVS